MSSCADEDAQRGWAKRIRGKISRERNSSMVSELSICRGASMLVVGDKDYQAVLVHAGEKMYCNRHNRKDAG
ncbi:MAG: hypothetical protein ABW140_05765 [Candidatus Sedimenticola sp. 6PFRAG1]